MLCGGLPADPNRDISTLSRDPAPCSASTSGAKLDSLEVEVLGAGPPSQDAPQGGQAEPQGPGLVTSESSLNLRH